MRFYFIFKCVREGKFMEIQHTDVIKALFLLSRGNEAAWWKWLQYMLFAFNTPPSLSLSCSLSLHLYLSLFHLQHEGERINHYPWLWRKQRPLNEISAFLTACTRESISPFISLFYSPSFLLYILNRDVTSMVTSCVFLLHFHYHYNEVRINLNSSMQKYCYISTIN